jgi:crossover junction endodeoxyribonuclease RuvC
MPLLNRDTFVELYMGIDPGMSGGIAVISFSREVYALEKMPVTERAIWKLVKKFEPIMAMIEKVHAMPKQGVSSTFKFGCGYGGLRMALTAAGIPFDEVTPQAWQKAMGVTVRNTKTETKRDHKKKLLAKAERLFPKCKPTLSTADALLIADYCLRASADYCLRASKG